jgi:hypothetical protein
MTDQEQPAELAENDRATDDAREADQSGEPVDGDDAQETLIDTHVAEGEQDVPPAEAPDADQ